MAAFLCYMDELPDDQIAARFGVARRTLARWKHRPEFAVAVRTAALVGGELIHRYESERSDYRRRVRQEAVAMAAAENPRRRRRA